MKASSFGIAGIEEISINYNEANDRVTSLDWVIPTGKIGYATVWKSGQVVYDNFCPAGTGSQSIAGNTKVIEVTEFGDTFKTLPPEIEYTFSLMDV